MPKAPIASTSKLWNDRGRADRSILGSYINSPTALIPLRSPTPCPEWNWATMGLRITLRHIPHITAVVEATSFPTYWQPNSVEPAALILQEIGSPTPSNAPSQVQSPCHRFKLPVLATESRPCLEHIVLPIHQRWNRELQSWLCPDRLRGSSYAHRHCCRLSRRALSPTSSI